jgi:hypothetical protein
MKIQEYGIWESEINVKNVLEKNQPIIEPGKAKCHPDLK